MHPFLKTSLLLTTLVVLLATVWPAQAQIQLKTGGRGATPLRVKALHADVQVKGQFAATQMAVTFQNEIPYQTEADFLYRLPGGAVITDFAYYYGSERVPARIVEKKQAETIYRRLRKSTATRRWWRWSARIYSGRASPP